MAIWIAWPNAPAIMFIAQTIVHAIRNATTDVHVIMKLIIVSGTAKTVSFACINRSPSRFNGFLEKINVEVFDKCQSEAFEAMTNCTSECDISYECHQLCGSNYYESLRSCPCMEQCPGSLELYFLDWYNSHSANIVYIWIHRNYTTKMVAHVNHTNVLMERLTKIRFFFLWIQMPLKIKSFHFIWTELAHCMMLLLDHLSMMALDITNVLSW